MNIQAEAFNGEQAKLRKKLDEQGLVFQFDAGTPLQMIVGINQQQVSFEEEDEFSFVLSMDVWGRISYSFKGCDWTTVPEAVLSTCKTGFRKIAGAYLMLEHYTAREAASMKKEPPKQ